MRCNHAVARECINMQIAYRARDIAEAHIVAGMLRAQGIEAHVGGHYLQGAMGEIGTQDYSLVHVEDADIVEARRLMADYEAQPCSTPAAISSGQTRSVLMVMGVFVLIVMALAFGAI